MRRVPADVWVAGLLSPSGPPARVVDLSLTGTLVPVVSPDIVREYEPVLLHRNLALSGPDVNALMAYLKIPGSHVVHVDPGEQPRVCADPDDDKSLAAAVEGGAAAVVTGNMRHYPASPWHGIVIASPAAVLRSLSRIE